MFSMLCAWQPIAAPFLDPAASASSQPIQPAMAPPANAKKRVLLIGALEKWVVIGAGSSAKASSSTLECKHNKSFVMV